MALGRRGGREQALWVAASALPRSAGHPFYTRLDVALSLVSHLARSMIPLPNGTRPSSTGCYAERFAAAGFTVLVFGYRRFGNREGRERNAGKENVP